MRFSVFFMAFITSSCINNDGYSPKLSSSLDLAGDNKDEILKVLNHYKSSKDDSLKFEAACYLIENMNGHYSTSKVKNYQNDIKSIFEKSNTLIKHGYFDPFYSPAKDIHRIRYQQVQLKDKLASQDLSNLVSHGVFIDLESLNSDWLIDHIDNAFTVWRESKYAKNLNFDEFKTLILPYRSRNEITDIRSQEYKYLLKDILKIGSSRNLDEVVNRFNTYISKIGILTKYDRNLGDLGFYNILQFEKLECGTHSEWAARALTSSGIPTVYDFTPSWLNRDRHHFWICVREGNGCFRPFTPMWQNLNDSIYFSETSKVYRKTFSTQENPYSLRNKKEQIPPIFDDPFIKDVSNEYHTVVDLNLPYQDVGNKNKLTYLAIFSASGWKPVGWGLIDYEGKSLNYRDVPIGNVYISCVLSKGLLVPNSPPFFLLPNGDFVWINPNYNKLININLTRKFHEKTPLIEYMEYLVGARIEASNNKNFGNSETIYTLKYSDIQDMVLKTINLSNVKKYRYVRLIPKRPNTMHIASLEFYTFKPEHKFYPLKFTSQNSTKNILGLFSVLPQSLSDTIDYTKMMDGDMETFISKDSICLDFKTPILLSQIRLAPRNSNNAIVIGNDYELLYFDKVWKSCGIKRATKNYVSFPQVPSNAIYWLRNLTAGKEEQAFVYLNNRQIFINESNYINKKWIHFNDLFTRNKYERLDRY